MSLRAKLKCVQRTQDAAPPIVASFPNGCPPPQGGLPDHQLGFFHFVHSDERKRGQRVVLADGSAVKYEAKNFGNQSSKRNLAKYFVAVFDRPSKRARLMEVEHVFPLQQSVKAGAEQHVPSLDGVDERTRRMMLVETFGSKKRQREQRSRQANAVDAERVVASGAISNILAKNSVVAIKDNVAAATEAAAGSTAGNAESSVFMDSLQRAHLEARKQLLPAFDMTATTPDKIYDIKSIISDEDWRALSTKLKTVTSAAKQPKAIQQASEALAKNEEPPAACPFRSALVLRRLPSLRAMDKASKLRVARLLAFLELLHRLSLQHARIVLHDDLATTLDAPMDMVKRQLYRFSERLGKAFVRTDVMRDKLLMHMLVLCLIIDGFVADVQEVAADLRLPLPKCTTYFRQIGCVTDYRKGSSEAGEGGEDGSEDEGAEKPKRSAAQRQMRLRAPLKFPLARRQKAKR